ncbi:hypothetical protein DM860_004972 [Cuscuta australis]|uniref:Uncharacterized protein n=1 Tax=Cuscuta australis TaxID=267555 RepID=A0A328DRT9_9ASTE|nr:hypothetical protein DM860_004972 [Cuscuta australis]
MGKQNPWVLSNSPEKNDAEQEQDKRREVEEDDDDEALSLSDLPNDQQGNQFKKESPVPGDESEQGEFDFCSLAGSMKESEMCLADELFFGGQILPLRRHSVSADSASAALRCNSMERCRSATSASSRSSSTRSHQSSSSATSSAAASGKPPRSWNRFQFSQPSPTPHIRLPKASSRGPTASSNGHPRSSSSSSALWTLFRVGLVTMPEFGSRSFTRVTSGDKSDHDDINNNRSKVVRSLSSGGSVDSGRSNAVTKKLKQIFVHKNMAFFETCKCSVNSVENVPLRSDMNGEEDKKKKKKKKDGVVSGKQSMSRIRTFEWLKQLSLDGEAATEHRVDRNVNH